jgi:hypothetical protein
VFLFDIDACGFIEIVHAGVFDDVTQAYRVASACGRYGSERTARADRRRSACSASPFAMRRRGMSLAAARSLYHDLDTDPMVGAFTGWHVRRHGTEPDP